MNDRKNLLLALAVATSPLVWAAVCFGLAALVLYAIYAYCRAECRTPPRCPKPVTPPAEEDRPLDERGRVELVMHAPNPVAVAPPVTLEPALGPRARARKCKRTKKGDVPTTPERRDDLTHADLVRLAHKAGRKNANGRWSRARLLAVVADPCSRKEGR